MVENTSPASPVRRACSISALRMTVSGFGSEWLCIVTGVSALGATRVGRSLESVTPLAYHQ
jgi:hypothetical protein